MADNADNNPGGGPDKQPESRPGHKTDDYATKFVDKTGAMQEKAKQKTPGAKDDHEKKGPAGGFDPTSIPKAKPGYTIKFTFHRAKNLPMADINTLSSDPYIVATLKTSLPLRHKEDPRIQWRIPTIRRNTQPEWNSEWIVANVPGNGFFLKCRIYDEDPANHDDRLGNIHVYVDQVNENWGGIKEEAYKIKKRMGSKRAYFVRGCAAMFNRSVKMSGEVVISIEVLGRTDAENGGRMYTVGPCNWTKHFSPLIGRLAGTKEAKENANDDVEKNTESYKYC